jgi:outer membrane protein assembly factor BamD (BamD/ComL family)
MNVRDGIALVVTFLVAGAVVSRADIIITKTLIHTGEVVRTEADGVTVKLPALGELKVYKADIVQIEIAKPATLESVPKLLQGGSFQDAVTVLKPIVDRYAGLDVAWVQEAVLQLGNAYLGANDFPSARATFDQFARLYPQAQQTAGLEVRYARVLFEEKDYTKASEQLHNFLTSLLKREFLTDAQENAVSEGLALQGDCQRAQNQPAQALDSYLAVVTMFDVNADRAAEARYKAGQTFEELKNWNRAKDTYGDLLKETPGVAFAPEAQKRLAALTKDHPE